MKSPFPFSRLRLLCLCVLLPMLTSCFSYQDVEIKDIAVTSFSLKGSQLELGFKAELHNPNRAFVIKQAEGLLNRGNSPFATARLAEPILVAARSEQSCSGKILLTVNDFMAALAMGADYKSWDLDAFLCDGYVQLQAAWVKKKIKFENVTLKQIINSI